MAIAKGDASCVWLIDRRSRVGAGGRAAGAAHGECPGDSGRLPGGDVRAGEEGRFQGRRAEGQHPAGRSDVTIGGRAAPTPFGFGGWVALTKGDGQRRADGRSRADGGRSQSGDVGAARQRPRRHGAPQSLLLGAAAHLLHARPRPRQRRRNWRPAREAGDRSDRPGCERRRQAPGLTRHPRQAPPTLDAAALAKIVGTPGEQTGPVYKITIGRPDINVREHGATINARMGLNTWAAFAGSNADAMVAGDVAMLEHEVTPVLKVLRANGINVVAIHHHMTDVQPVVVFLHYYGTGRAAKLAEARSAVDLLGKSKARQSPAGERSCSCVRMARPRACLHQPTFSASRRSEA